MKRHATITVQIPLEITPDLLERIISLAESASRLQAPTNSITGGETDARGEHLFTEDFIIWKGTLKKRTTPFLCVGDN